MRRFRLVVAAFAAALLVPAAAFGAEQNLTFRSAPITIKAYGVVRDVMRADSPTVDGYVTGMSADVVDEAGNVVPDTDVMLHHVVFVKVFAQEPTCSTFTDYDGNQTPALAQRFYGEGEEHASLNLPTGYGYQNAGSDTWGLVYMLMNHHARSSTVHIRYHVRYVTGETLTPVTPLWLDVRNCLADPIFNVPGIGGRNSEYAQSTSWTVPQTGRLVTAGGHLHGGGLRLELSDSRCGTVFVSRPTWGGMEPVPAMHEPGPTQMTSFSDARGIPVRAGDSLQLKAVYDNSLPHVRVMGIVMAFLAPDPTAAGCASIDPTPAEPSGRSPRIVLPLLKKPAGLMHRNIRSTWVSDYRFGAQRVVIKRGTTFTWRFVGRVAHDVTLASGPVGFASQSRTRGIYKFRFTRRGTYKIFCSFHPMLMTQIIVVR
jgi:plastocyanin